ncbi:MAG TPA: isochorismatase family protein [Miltoncostaeaceae bacterium]|nr:isochorismatase family protein [Miltoncostaeaceae bacterium]
MAAVDGSRHPALLERERTGLILIDVQEAFRPVIDRFDEVIANCGLLAEGFGVLGRPVLVSEQYPKGLGHTVPELAARLPEGARLVEKVRFSACGVSAFDEAVAESGATSFVVAGIEAHVCVNQTVHDLLQYGFQVQVAADAVSSRTPRNRDLGMAKMSAAGAGTTSAEMALFEMLEQAGSDEFKQISRLVR